MNSRCDKYLESIAAMAFGDSQVADSAHILSCAGCSAKLAEMRKTIELGRVPSFTPPVDILARAKNLMPARERRSLIARLTGNSLSMAGARSTATDNFQLAFEAEDVKARLMFAKEGSAWNVMGQVAPSTDTVTVDGKALKLDADGRFQFKASSLAKTGMVIAAADREVQVPSAQEILDGGS